MTDKIPLKYSCIDRFSSVLKKCIDDDAAKLLIEMYDLILYQMNEIKKQRMDIIGMKHKIAWNHYDRPISEYDSSTRQYVDRPAKSGNISC
jgi:hypothetical protein